jgi:Mor family transcriptional regulator
MKSPTLQEIVEVIGVEAAAKIVSQIGGVTYYFPPDGSESERVSIEAEAWQAMCKRFSGWVYVPKGFSDKLATRNIEIRKKRSSGARIIDLAIEYNLTDRRIRTICGGLRILNKSHNDLDKWANAYKEKFGSLPVGINYPELTVDLLRAAIEIGKEIEPLPVLDGADV